MLSNILEVIVNRFFVNFLEATLENRDRSQLLTKPNFVRAGYDVLALLAGSAFGLYVSGQYDFTKLNTVSSVSWLPFVILLPLIGITLFWRLGLYTGLRQREIRSRLTGLVFGTVLIFAVMALVLSFFKELTFGKLLAFGLAWLSSSVALTLPRMVYEFARREIDGKATAAKARRANTVLVIGGAGYIGSYLVPKLLDSGFEVIVLDIMAFGEKPIAAFKDHPKVKFVQEDYRNIQTLLTHIRGVESVVHLGGLVGDPACAVDEALTVDINVTSTRLIAEISKSHGVKRFVFASSCSIYGANDHIVDETSSFNPQSLYAKSKVASEAVISEFASKEFEAVYLRLGTIYGLSGRTRFDLVVNLLAAKAVMKGEITVFGSDQWRPFVHVEDAARAFEMALKAESRLVANQAFNVGSNGQNMTLMQLAERINKLVPTAKILVTDENVDRRNYRVDFSKIEKTLGFKPQWTIEQGISQVIESIHNGTVKDIDQPLFSNIKLMQERGKELFGSTYNHGWEDSYLAQLSLDHKELQ
jgi:nucleoside-diphosphate-sugar epimerase